MSSISIILSCRIYVFQSFDLWKVNTKRNISSLQFHAFEMQKLILMQQNWIHFWTHCRPAKPILTAANFCEWQQLFAKREKKFHFMHYSSESNCIKWKRKWKDKRRKEIGKNLLPWPFDSQHWMQQFSCDTFFFCLHRIFISFFFIPSLTKSENVEKKKRSKNECVSHFEGDSR